MSLTAATITVYFVGLVTFYDPSTTPQTREVIPVRLASPIQTCGGLTTHAR